MLVVDHDMALIMRICNRIYVLDNGQIIAEGAPAADPRRPPGGAGVSRRGGCGMSATLLEARGLRTGYGRLPVVFNVDLEVKEGEIVALLGANGAGKTTTLRALSGMLPLMAGEVRLDGTSLNGQRARQDRARRRRPRPAGTRDLPQPARGRDAAPRVRDGRHPPRARSTRASPTCTRSSARLYERRTQLAGTLSGGEQQMLAIARGLIMKPRLLMIDEMSQGLAPTIVQGLFDIVRSLPEQGVSVLIVEQFVTHALAVASRAYVLEKGEVAFSGDAAELARDEAFVKGSYLGDGATDAVGRDRSFASTTTDELPLHADGLLERSKTGRRRKAATRPKSSSTCSGKRSRARRDRGTAREVRREEAGSSRKAAVMAMTLATFALGGGAGVFVAGPAVGGVVEGKDDNQDNDNAKTKTTKTRRHRRRSRRRHRTAGGALLRHQRNGERRERSRDRRQLGVPELHDGRRRQLLLDGALARRQLAVRRGNGEPRRHRPVGQTAAAGNFQQPQYADARWPGDSAKAAYGNQGGPVCGGGARANTARPPMPPRRRTD